MKDCLKLLEFIKNETNVTIMEEQKELFENIYAEIIKEVDCWNAKLINIYIALLIIVAAISNIYVANIYIKTTQSLLSHSYPWFGISVASIIFATIVLNIIDMIISKITSYRRIRKLESIVFFHLNEMYPNCFSIESIKFGRDMPKHLSLMIYKNLVTVHYLMGLEFLVKKSSNIVKCEENN